MIFIRSFCQNTTSIMSKFYAVSVGRNPGIYATWAECEAQVKGFSGAKYKKFNSQAGASDFVGDGCSSSGTSSTSKYDNTDRGWSSQSTAAPNDYARKRKGSHMPGGSHSVDVKRSCTNGVQMANQFRSNPASARNVYTKGNVTTAQSGCAKGSLANWKKVVAYTDGCCLSNGKKVPMAGVGVYWGPNDHRNVAQRLIGKQTNNRAEIQAAVKAIQQAKMDGADEVEIRTDSQFLISSATKWMPKWKQNDWKLAAGGKVKNRKDFEEIDAEMQDISVKFTHVAAHTGIPGNEAADGLANEGALKYHPRKNEAGEYDSDDSVPDWY